MKIALTGFSYSGKTTAGKLIAEKLNLKFYDSDEIIKSSYGDIKQIFLKYGEQYFREIEENTIKDIVLNNNDFVLSLGAGAAQNKNTVKLLKNNTITVWLKTSVENIIKRSEDDHERPLLNGADRVDIIRSLYNKRAGLYDFADIAVSTDNETPNQTANRVIKMIKLQLTK